MQKFLSARLDRNTNQIKNKRKKKSEEDNEFILRQLNRTLEQRKL